MWGPEEDFMHLLLLFCTLYFEISADEPEARLFWLAWPDSKLPESACSPLPYWGHRHTQPSLGSTWELGIQTQVLLLTYPVLLTPGSPP